MTDVKEKIGNLSNNKAIKSSTIDPNNILKVVTKRTPIFLVRLIDRPKIEDPALANIAKIAIIKLSPIVNAICEIEYIEFNNASFN